MWLNVHIHQRSLIDIQNRCKPIPSFVRKDKTTQMEKWPLQWKNVRHVGTRYGKFLGNLQPLVCLSMFWPFHASLQGPTTTCIRTRRDHAGYHRASGVDFPQLIPLGTGFSWLFSEVLSLKVAHAAHSHPLGWQGSAASVSDEQVAADKILDLRKML